MGFLLKNNRYKRLMPDLPVTAVCPKCGREIEKWQTGWSSALAIVLFLTVFGAANIYVKVLNRVKQR